MTVTAVILGAGKGSRMQSELPKVLHPVGGTPMLIHAINRAREAGADHVVCVVGYGREQVAAAIEHLDVTIAVQAEQLGTGHAVASAQQHINGAGEVLVLYGDMPLLSSETIRRLVDRRREGSAACVALTIELENPPAFGRIIRNDSGDVLRIVEEKDCTPEELAVNEVNVGAYCFTAPELTSALSQLRNDNAQNEYYLTDVPGILVQEGHVVTTVQTDSLEETLGVNDPHAVEFAEKLDDIRYAESLYELVDAALHLERNRTSGDS